MNDVRAPYDAWWFPRQVLKVLWAAFSAFVAFAVSGLWGWRLAAAQYCDPPEPDPLLDCWPSFEENPWAHVEVWAWAIGTFVLLTIPLWRPLLVRARERSRQRP
jgi:hypothetical protein